MLRFLIGLPLFVLVAPLVACEQGGGRLRGSYLEVPDCGGLFRPTRFEPFELDLEHMGVTVEGDAAIVHMSPSAKEIDEADQIAISFEGVRDLESQLRDGNEVTLALSADGTGEANLSFVLLGRCGLATTPITATGSIKFSRFGQVTGEFVTGTMTFDAYDRRTGRLLGESFVGDFDFRAGKYSPFIFYSKPDF